MIEVISHDELVFAVKLLFFVCVWELFEMLLRNLLFTSYFSASHTNVKKPYNKKPKKTSTMKQNQRKLNDNYFDFAFDFGDHHHRTHQSYYVKLLC